MKFKFHKENIARKARSLRRQGISAAKIAERLNISNTTVLRWCSDIPSTNPYHFYMEKVRKKAKERSTGLTKDIKMTKENAKILTALLYWCEGAKYPSTNFISFSNSDINLVITFLKLFRLGFKPKEDKLRVHLQLHTTHNRKKMIFFWSRILKIPKTKFYKPTITKPTKNMKRRNYKGTCTIRYYNVYTLLEMTGIFEEFSKRIHEIK